MKISGQIMVINLEVMCVKDFYGFRKIGRICNKIGEGVLRV
jgi:hypothetical protein